MNENTQTSMVKYMDEKYTNFDGWKNSRKTQKNMDKKYTKFTKTLLVEKIHGKKPTVREKIKFLQI